MSTLLAEAIGKLNLKPGQTYRATVQDYEIEVRRRDEAPPASPADESLPTPDYEMVNLWLEIPPSPAARTVTATRGEPELPPALHLDESDLAPE